jgi:hypothetical protein
MKPRAAQVDSVQPESESHRLLSDRKILRFTPFLRKRTELVSAIAAS